MAFTQPAAKDIPSCRRGPEGRTHTVQLCSILNNLKYQHCTHSSPSPSPSLLVVTSPIPSLPLSLSNDQSPTASPDVLHDTHPSWHSPRSPADPSVPSEPAAFTLGDHRACASTLAYNTRTHTRYVTLCLRLPARTHAAKDGNPTHPEPVPDLLVTVRRMRFAGCGAARFVNAIEREAMGMRNPDAG
jgi:hypothetical protein